MTLLEIKAEAQSLSDRDKGALVADLLGMISPSDYWVSDAEVLERVRQVETGEVEEIAFDELKQRLGK